MFKLLINVSTCVLKKKGKTSSGPHSSFGPSISFHDLLGPAFVETLNTVSLYHVTERGPLLPMSAHHLCYANRIALYWFAETCFCTAEKRPSQDFIALTHLCRTFWVVISCAAELVGIKVEIGKWVLSWGEVQYILVQSIQEQVQYGV